MERHIKNINLLTRSVNDALEMCLTKPPTKLSVTLKLSPAGWG